MGIAEFKVDWLWWDLSHAVPCALCFCPSGPFSCSAQLTPSLSLAVIIMDLIFSVCLTQASTKNGTCILKTKKPYSPRSPGVHELGPELLKHKFLVWKGCVIRAVLPSAGSSAWTPVDPGGPRAPCSELPPAWEEQTSQQVLTLLSCAREKG